MRMLATLLVVVGASNASAADVELRLGWPESGIAWRADVGGDWTLGPRLGIASRLPIEVPGVVFCCGLGGMLSIEAVGPVFARGDWSIRLEGELGALLDSRVLGGPTGGLRVRSEVIGRWAFAARWWALASTEVRADTYFSRPLGAVVPCLFGAGVQFAHRHDLAFVLTVRAGPSRAVSEVSVTGDEVTFAFTVLWEEL